MKSHLSFFSLFICSVLVGTQAKAEFVCSQYSSVELDQDQCIQSENSDCCKNSEIPISNCCNRTSTTTTGNAIKITVSKKTMVTRTFKISTPTIYYYQSLFSADAIYHFVSSCSAIFPLRI
jgi:hypothetical protein